MFYEGTEKRLEICINDLDLLQFSDVFWAEMLHQAGAFILSEIKTPHCKAYLLSESSLFIWQDKLLLITCGNTHLVKAAQYFQKKVLKENINSLLFHRHQAIQPHLQQSNFSQDSKILMTNLGGNTQHWRGNYQGDLFYFSNKINQRQQDNKQILMCHGLQGQFANKLQTGEATKVEIEKAISVARFFPQLQVDQYIFKPKGYSLNAVHENDYLTIHLTPEISSTYISVETSYLNKSADDFIDHLQRLFQPKQSNLMRFIASPEDALTITLSEPQNANLLLCNQ